MFKKIIDSPQKVFVFDGLGALLSAVLLGVVLTSIHEMVGLPLNILYGLAGIAVVLSVYSFTCAFLIKQKWRSLLQGIMAANLSYIMVSVGVIIIYFNQLTLLGLSYFVLEILVLLGVVFLESKALLRQ